MHAERTDTAATLDSAFRLTRRRLVPFLLLMYVLTGTTLLGAALILSLRARPRLAAPKAAPAS